MISAEDYKSQASATSIRSAGTKVTPSPGPSVPSAAPSVASKPHSLTPTIKSVTPSVAPTVASVAPTVASVAPSVQSAPPSVATSARSAAYSTASSVPTVLQRTASATSHTPSITPSVKSASHPPSMAQTVSAAEPQLSIRSQASVKSQQPSGLSTTTEGSVKGDSPPERALTTQSSVRFDMGGQLIDTKTSNVDAQSLQQSVLSTASVTDVDAPPPEPSTKSFYSAASQPSAISEMQTESKLMSSKATVCERCSTKQVGLQIGNCVQKNIGTESELGVRSTHTTTKSSSIGFSVERSASAQSFRGQYSLDFNKIKKELRSGCPSVRVMLLQALRWVR